MICTVHGQSEFEFLQCMQNSAVVQFLLVHLHHVCLFITDGRMPETTKHTEKSNGRQTERQTVKHSNMAATRKR